MLILRSLHNGLAPRTRILLLIGIGNNYSPRGFLSFPTNSIRHIRVSTRQIGYETWRLRIKNLHSSVNFFA